MAWGKLYKKYIFENTRYPTGKLHEDEYVTYKILFSLNEISYVDAPLYYYFKNPNGITGKWDNRRIYALDAFNEQVEYFLNRGSKKLAVFAAGVFFYKTSVFYKAVNENSGENKNESVKYIERKAKEGLKKYKELTDASIEKYPYFYWVARPVYSKIYWSYKALVSKIKKLFRLE